MKVISEILPIMVISRTSSDIMHLLPRLLKYLYKQNVPSRVYGPLIKNK